MTALPTMPPIGILNNEQLASLTALALGEMIARKRITLQIGDTVCSSEQVWIALTSVKDRLTVTAYPSAGDAPSTSSSIDSPAHAAV